MRDWRLILFALCAFAADLGGAFAQEHIGSTAVAHNDVTRDLAGAMGPLTVGDSVYRNEVVRTGADSTAKLIFLDSTNLGVGPVSRVTLDQFVYVGQSNGQKMAVNLAKGVFRFTTGKLDKSAYIISTPSAAIGVRGTVLDISVRSAQSRVTLVEGQALVCPRRPGITFEQQARNCARAAGEILERLQKGGRKVCFVGDGMNDSIALKKADVSISLRGDSTIATDTAHVIFLEGGLAKLCELRDITHNLDRNVNRSWSMIVAPNVSNVIGVFTMGFGIMSSVLTNNVYCMAALANGLLPPAQGHRLSVGPDTDCESPPARSRNETGCRSILP